MSGENESYEGEVVNDQPQQANGQTRVPPGAGQTASDGFGTSSLAVSAETAALAQAAKQKALVEARYIVAMQRPRDMDNVRVKVLAACKRPSFAKVARYRKPIGSSAVFGPSVRFAEEAMRAMGNITAETSLVREDSSQRVFSVTVTDLEANTPWSQDITVEKTVERAFLKDGQRPISVRTNSRGKKTYTVEATDEDLLNKQNALISKALRTLILRIVPGDILDEAMIAVIKTQETEDAADPDAARKALVDAFAGIGVKPSDVKQFLGHDIGTASPAELVELRAVFAAIRDGEASWPETLAHKQRSAPSGEEPKPTTAKEKVAAKAKAAKEAPKPTTKEEIDPETGEIVPSEEELRQPGQEG